MGVLLTDLNRRRARAILALLDAGYSHAWTARTENRTIDCWGNRFGGAKLVHECDDGSITVTDVANRNQMLRVCGWCAEYMGAMNGAAGTIKHDVCATCFTQQRMC